MEKIKVMLADDHTLVREGLKQLLMTFENIEVIGEAEDGVEAIDLVQKIQPDIFIMDISMPKMRGIEAMKEIKYFAPDTRVIILSMYSKEEYIRHSLENGASAYLLKQSASEELRAAIQFVMRGQLYISPIISKPIISDWLMEKKHNFSEEDMKSPLSGREQQVLKLLAEEYSNKEIAELLHISVKTVETHRARIKEKLGAKSTIALVKYALRNRLITID